MKIQGTDEERLKMEDYYDITDFYPERIVQNRKDRRRDPALASEFLNRGGDYDDTLTPMGGEWSKEDKTFILTGELDGVEKAAAIALGEEPTEGGEG